MGRRVPCFVCQIRGRGAGAQEGERAEVVVPNPGCADGDGHAVFAVQGCGEFQVQPAKSGDYQVQQSLLGDY